MSDTKLNTPEREYRPGPLPFSESYANENGGLSRFISQKGARLDDSQPALPVTHRKLGNPSILGLLAFAATILVSSMYSVQARGVGQANMILGMAITYGGGCQCLAGIQEWACGNTFGAAAFSSYGAFWLSFATLYIPQFGVRAAYDSQAEYDNALGLYLISWGIVTTIFLIASLRSSIALVVVFFGLNAVYWLLGAGHLAQSDATIKAGGVVGILTAFAAFYTALAGLLTRDTSFFLLPVGDLSRVAR